MAASHPAKALRIGRVLASYGSRAHLSRNVPLEGRFESDVLRRSLLRAPKNLRPG